MKLAALRLRQRDGVTCGPAVAVVAGALLDPRYRTSLLAPGAGTVDAAGLAWFSGEQGRIHGQVNRIWPRRLGTTPMGMARALSARSAGQTVRYRWRIFGGLFGGLFGGRRDGLADVRQALAAGLPVPMLIGGLIPRHWVLLVSCDERAATVQCYEPSSGAVLCLPLAALRAAAMSGPGFRRPFAFVVPRGGPWQGPVPL